MIVETALIERIKALLRRVASDVASEIIHDASRSCMSCNGPTDDHTEDCFVMEAARLFVALRVIETQRSGIMERTFPKGERHV